MRRTGQSAGNRGAIAALVAIFALLIQALAPAAAMAASRASGETMIICTAYGAQTVTQDGAPAPKPKGFGGLPCQDCLAAAMAAIAAPELAIQPVAYVTARVEHAAAAPAPAPRARSPPRPFGQGPPTA